MSRIALSLATESDDAALCALMRDVHMPGRMAVQFGRDPSYLTGSLVQGENPRIIIARDVDRDAIVGVGAKLEKELYLNGSPLRCGYLSDLRITESNRRNLLLHRGYRLLHELHRREPLPCYLTMIFGDNALALRTLASGRANLPRYVDRGRILTPALFLDVPRKQLRVSRVRFERAAEEDMPAILRFLRAELPHKQFAPVSSGLRMKDYAARGLQPSDFYIASRDGEIVGVVAAWEQHQFRQVSIVRYPLVLDMVRPLYNLLAEVLPLRKLPAPGETIRFFYLSFVAVRGNDVETFRGLLRFVYLDRRSGPWSFCVAGLHESDPLVEALAEYRKIDAFGHLFVVHYPENEGVAQTIDDRVPYFEMATA